MDMDAHTRALTGDLQLAQEVDVGLLVVVGIRGGENRAEGG